MSFDKNDDGDSESTQLNNPRRRFLAGSAGALGGLAIGGAFATSSVAATMPNWGSMSDDHTNNDADDNDTEDEQEEMDDGGFEDDVAILNYARTLELLEFRFYERGLNNIPKKTLFKSDQLENFGAPIKDRVYEEIETIRDHEEIHADTLAAVVEDLGGEPVAEPEFDFGTAVEVPEEFIATAVQLEDTGVSAYAGAAPFIQNPDLVPPALSIHSVEARHASYLRVLNHQAPFPDAFDEARSQSEVLDIAGGFIVGDMDEDTDDDMANGNGTNDNDV